MGTRWCGSAPWARCRRRRCCLPVAVGALGMALEAYGSTVGSHGFSYESFGFLLLKSGDSFLFPTDGATNRT